MANIENTSIDQFFNYIEELDKSMVSQNYVNWMNDPKVNEYMETRHYKHTMDSVLKFVNQKKIELIKQD